MKRVVAGLALALAVGVFASHPQTINKEGFVGVNKTQSGQSLGHSKLSIFALFDYADGYKNMGQASFLEAYHRDDASGNYFGPGPVKEFMALNANVGFALGLWHYFDVGVALPVYYDKFSLITADGMVGQNLQYTEGSRNVGSIGNLKVNLKGRFPLPEDQPMDLALFLGASFPTANQKKQGVWVRELEYIRTDNGQAAAFGTSSSTLKFGLAATADFSKLDEGEGIPFLIHVNGGYRYTSSKDDVYLGVPFVSAAVEYYFVDFLSIFAEYFMDIQMDDFTYLKGPEGEEIAESLDLQQLTAALVFHTRVGLDIHLGASYYLGGDKKIHYVKVWQDEQDESRKEGYTLDATRVNPEYTVYGGITWSGFLLAQDRDKDGVTDDEDKCPDDYGHRLNQGCPLGNPDSDEDGVCDSWVSERGFESEFADICEGIDECPNEPG